jgi:hypothetical protein
MLDEPHPSWGGRLTKATVDTSGEGQKYQAQFRDLATMARQWVSKSCRRPL